MSKRGKKTKHGEMDEEKYKDDLERMYTKYVKKSSDYDEKTSTLQEIKNLIKKDFGDLANNKLIVALGNYSFKQGPQPYETISQEIIGGKPKEGTAYEKFKEETQKGGKYEKVSPNAGENRARLREVAERIPRDAQKLVNRLPFKVYDVHILTRKSVNGQKGDVVFRHAGKSYRLPGGKK